MVDKWEMFYDLVTDTW